MSLADKIKAIPGRLSKEAVLELVKDAVVVEVDPEMHRRQPENVQETIAWAVLDTAYGLLRDGAVRINLQSFREQATENGIDFPATDEELFARFAKLGDPEAPKSYRDLAPDDSIAAYALHDAFMLLVRLAFEEAVTELKGNDSL